MERNFSPWNTHDWISRRIELVAGHPLIQQSCRECGRAFVEERSTGERYAVHVSIFIFHRLSDEVTAQWLAENCPAHRLIADEADRETRFFGGSSRSGVAERASEDLDSGSSSDRKAD
jgi:hypothetical protein